MKNCLNCGREMTRKNYLSNSHFRRAKCCSLKCAKQYYYRGHSVTYNCKQCNKETSVKLAIYNKAKTHFCSTKCANVYKGTIRSGINHWNWMGGKAEQRKLRQSSEYNEWRLFVYKRDFYTCQKCGQKHYKLIAHHIKSYSEFEKLRLDIDNGITLCRSCHAKIHRESRTARFITHQVSFS